MKYFYSSAFEKCGKEEFPGEDDIKSLRKTLHKHFPKILGYGQLWSKGAKSGYEMHKRCKDPKPHQDCVFWTMISRLNREKEERKPKPTPEENPSKRRREATQVRSKIFFLNCDIKVPSVS